MNRFKLWKDWSKHHTYGKFYQILVLLGLAHSPTFEAYYIKPNKIKKPNYISTKIKPLDESDFDLTWEKKRTVISLVALLLSIISCVLSLTMFIYTIKDEEEPLVIVEKTASTDVLDDGKDFRNEIIQLKKAQKQPKVTAAPIEVETEIEEVKTLKYFDVPLDNALQDHIFAVCEERGVDPAIVIAMIQKESYFKPSNIGDGGNSLGLMQIQPRWHQDRANNLGCPDLMNPYHNITVGVDIFADHIKFSNSLEWALMAYNGGPSYANKMTTNGRVSDYVRTVISYSKNYEKRI